MRDLFREGLTLGESLARLPWEAARRVAGGRSETLHLAADLGERLGTLPFRAAGRMFRPDGKGQGQGAGPAPGPAPAPRSRRPVPDGRERSRVVVLGAGYGGLTCFLELQDHLSRDYDLVLVNGDRYHWFTTELHTLVAGEHEDAVRVPLSRIITSPGRLVVDRVSKVDPQAREVHLASGQRLGYDLLVFGLGSDPEYFGLPGVAEYSLIVGNWQGATNLRERVAGLIEGPGDAVRHVVVAGGGLTGVELAGELADEYRGRIRLTIVEAGPDIMAGFAPGLVRISREVLQEKGVEIRTGNPITRVDQGKVTFKDGETLTFDVLVWAGGVRGSAILAQSGFETTPRGRGLVDPYLRAVGHPEVYLVGDSAAFTDPSTGREVPPSGQAAVQMGRQAGRNILHRLRGRAEEPFVPHIKGAFASLGRREGVGQLGTEEYSGVPAMMIKHLVESHHAWETGAGVMPLINRLLRGPQRFMRGRSRQPAAPRPGQVAPTAARPEARQRQH
ncbi:MAG TPA: NAD(P)/FAD-dependent oxidoreductase [Symbiobacteriaceae bacterium]|nr:NAD(P)/FAD-dependent oxidoreductase [Symbiobacteriaceae bacterium]